MVFVININDRDRIGEAADELQKFLSTMSVEEVTEKMSSLKNKNCFIQGTSTGYQ